MTHGPQQVLSRSFGAAPGPQVRRYGWASGRYYGLLFPERGQVTLLDDSGREPEGFPLPGTTLFNIADLDLDGVLELVTITADGPVGRISDTIADERTRFLTRSVSRREGPGGVTNS